MTRENAVQLIGAVVAVLTIVITIMAIVHLL